MPERTMVTVIDREQLAELVPGLEQPRTWVAALNGAMARFDIVTTAWGRRSRPGCAKESGGLERFLEDLWYRAWPAVERGGWFGLGGWIPWHRARGVDAFADSRAGVHWVGCRA